MERVLSRSRGQTYKIGYSAKASAAVNETDVQHSNVRLERSIPARKARTKKILAIKKALLQRHGDAT